MANEDKNLKMKLCNLLGMNDEENLTAEDVYSACEQLKLERDRYYMAMDNCVDSFHITDSDGKIIFVNKVFSRRSKLNQSEIIGKNVDDLVRAGIYGPSAPRMALKENRQITLIQGGAGGDAIVTATPVKNKEGECVICVSNARFIDELTLLNNYYHNKDKVKDLSDIEITTKEDKIIKLYEFARQIAKSDSNVLITGETGTGKSLIARYIHDNSDRTDGRFIEVNCASIPENLIESELFGYESGAFTGAKKGGKPGLFEMADGGTLFLDEIGDMPLNLQVKLLSAIQNKKIVRIGGTNEKSVDVRIITATNRNLKDMMKKNEFREDLYYRINIVPLYMPALRERAKDINLLIESFLEQFNQKYHKNISIDGDALIMLNNYKWPGNIRELENLIERFVVTAKNEKIKLEDIPNNIRLTTDDIKDDIKINRIIPLKEALEKTEKQLVEMAFSEGKSSYRAAELLGISQSGASRKYLKYIKKDEK